MKNINFRHSIIFFNLCILMSPIYQTINYTLIIFCLFLILIIGISHGALDNIKGAKLLNLFGYKSMYLFYSSYIFISLLIISSWLILPNLVLLFFLIVAAYHFGKEDTIFKLKKNLVLKEVLFFFKGSPVIIAPLLFQRESTNEIFATLNFYIFQNPLFDDIFLIIFLVLSLFSSVYLSIGKSIEFKNVMILDYFSVIILNLFLNPIIAFTLYFCFLHSVRHSFSLINEMDKSFKKGLKKFIIKAIPLTLVTGLIFLISIYFLNNLYEIDEAIYKVIFIGLASLTFPHILLEYLIDKNEKKT